MLRRLINVVMVRRLPEKLMLSLVAALVSALFMTGVSNATPSGESSSLSDRVHFEASHGTGTQFGTIPSATDQTQITFPGTGYPDANPNLSPNGGASIAAPTAASGSGWSTVPTPNPIVPTGQLNAVSCAGASTCIAVGTSADASGLGVSLAERWNGTSWSRIPSANQPGAAVTDLTGVSCTSSTACTAVGWYIDGSGSGRRHVLAERWNGTAWSVESIPDPPEARIFVNLNFVSCSSASNCVAVGGYNNNNGVELTLAERWDGNTWTMQSTPNPSGSQYFNFLAGVSCASSTDCTAVGGSDVGALAERWNGTKWSIQSTPSPGQFPQLYSVSCTSASACIAVGVHTDPTTSNSVPLAEQWNGTKWSMQSIASPTGSQNSFLNGLSCPSSSACTADGGSDGSTLAEQWDGHSWSIQASPNPAQSGATFNGLSCPTATTCVGVGTASNASNTLTTFGESWNGSQWNLQATVNPAGDGGAQLLGVSCKSSSVCVAVGQSLGGTFAQQWNGTSWSTLPTPNPAGSAGSVLQGVSCSSPSACIAVGGVFDNSGNSTTLAEQWDGTTWTIEPTPASAGSRSFLSGISCSSPSSCIAVGNTATSPLAEHWDGTSWTIQPTPAPTGVQNSGFGGVSCTSASSCIAVGGTSDSSGNPAGTFAEKWNGTAWSMQPTPTATTPGYLMDAVSCTSASACTGVGQTGSGVLAERWNGTSWKVQLATTTGSSADAFSGVSCSSATACTAFGTLFPTAYGQTIAERWDGSTWSVQNTPTPPGAYDLAFPFAVSCPTLSVCIAVGGYANDGEEATLAEQWTGGASTSTCVVPNVKGKTLKAAKRKISKASCLLGRVTRRYSATVKVGHVISQKPKPTRREPADTKITLRVSRGRKRN